MALDRESMNLLSQKLAGGYHLNAQLQEVLGRPLDSRGQEAAMAVSQELSRVLMESMSMLNHDNSIRVHVVRTGQETMTGNSTGLSAPSQDKSTYSGQGSISLKKNAEEEVVRTETTTSPHKDGYQWRKYGQKNIQKCNFASASYNEAFVEATKIHASQINKSRYYYRCSRAHDRGCAAKKRVQQKDDGSDPPMFVVAYVNDHTCHVLHANDSANPTLPTTTTTTTTMGQYCPKVSDSTKNGALFGLFPHVDGGSVEETEAIVSCLATVINGTAPPPLSSSRPAAEAATNEHGHWTAYAPPQPGHSTPSLDDDGSVEDGTMMTMIGTGFSCDPSPVEEAELLFDHCDVHMGFMDTVWPQYDA
ncbi:hypothetical protein ACP70R_036528 [Stipagrostis hirtigluma subsp. patula]